MTGFRRVLFRSVFLATTSVTVFEFEILLMAFAEAFAETAHRTVTDEARFRKKGGGQRGKLPSLAAKLLDLIRNKFVVIATL